MITHETVYALVRKHGHDALHVLYISSPKLKGSSSTAVARRRVIGPNKGKRCLMVRPWILAWLLVLEVLKDAPARTVVGAVPSHWISRKWFRISLPQSLSRRQNKDLTMGNRGVRLLELTGIAQQCVIIAILFLDDCCSAECNAKVYSQLQTFVELVYLYTQQPVIYSDSCTAVRTHVHCLHILWCSPHVH